MNFCGSSASQQAGPPEESATVVELGESVLANVDHMPQSPVSPSPVWARSQTTLSFPTFHRLSCCSCQYMRATGYVL
jgi:hypothetical protein